MMKPPNDENELLRQIAEVSKERNRLAQEILEHENIDWYAFSDVESVRVWRKQGDELSQAFLEVVEKNKELLEQLMLLRSGGG